MAEAKTQNILQILAHVQSEHKKSKAGNQYRVLTLTFINGYQKRLFLDDAEWFVVDNLTEELEDSEINLNKE